MCGELNPEQEEKLQQLYRLSEEVHKRENVEWTKKLYEVQKSRQNSEIDDQEAAIKTQKLYAEKADYYVRLRKFKNLFCRNFDSIREGADIFFDATELASAVIISVNPVWALEPVTLSAIASLSVARILYKTIGIYCPEITLQK